MVTRQEKFRAILSAARVLRAAAPRRAAAILLLRTRLWVGDASRAGARTQTVAASAATGESAAAGRADCAAERCHFGRDERRIAHFDARG